MVILLKCILVLPLISFMAILISKGNRILILGLNCSLITLLASLVGVIIFNKATLGYQGFFTIPLLNEMNIELSFGVDGLSLFFVVLTSFIQPLLILVS